MRSDSGASDLLLLANIGKPLLEISNQVLALAGNVNRLFLATFRANPSSQFFRGRRKPNVPRV
jgi:hypothetical protein